MAVKGNANGYGSSIDETYASQYVFAINFNHPLSSKVKYEAYDNDQTFPATGNLTTTNYDVFGLSGGEDSMVALRDTTNGTSGAGTNWFPSSPNANTATINLLKGTTNFVTQHGATIDTTGGGTIYFNMQIKVPASTQTNSQMQFDLVARYTFTSTTPTVSWWFNNEDGGGTEASPSWATMPSGTYGIKHTRDGLTSSGPFLANIPETGQEKTQDAWMTT